MSETIDWNPAQTYKADAELLPIEAPPCPGCANWHPVRQYDSRGACIGVRLCQAEEQFVDFSCFVARQGKARAQHSKNESED